MIKENIQNRSQKLEHFPDIKYLWTKLLQYLGLKDYDEEDFDEVENSIEDGNIIREHEENDGLFGDTGYNFIYDLFLRVKNSLFNFIRNFPLTIVFFTAILGSAFLQLEFAKQETIEIFLISFRAGKAAGIGVLLSLLFDMSGRRFCSWTLKKRLITYVFELILLALFYIYLTPIGDSDTFTRDMVIVYALLFIIILLKCLRWKS